MRTILHESGKARGERHSEILMPDRYAEEGGFTLPGNKCGNTVLQDINYTPRLVGNYSGTCDGAAEREELGS